MLPFLFAAKVEVCISPGCVADGAQKTLAKLKALAPPSKVCVENGKCQSLCGKGPVLIQQEDSSERRVNFKYMKDEKLIPFLESCVDDDDWSIPNDLLEGYDLVAEGMELFTKKKYNEASLQLKQGIKQALAPAQSYGGDMEWLVQAHQSLADSLLQQQQQQQQNVAAMDAIQVAIQLDPKDGTSYEILARICQANKDEKGECEALETLLLELPEPVNPPRDVSNRRRELGFRLKSLQSKM